jgi:hypothetical protein
MSFYAMKEAAAQFDLRPRTIRSPKVENKDKNADIKELVVGSINLEQHWKLARKKYSTIWQKLGRPKTPVSTSWNLIRLYKFKYPNIFMGSNILLIIR